MQNRHIAFSPPDVGEDEIEAIAEALRSGWITTGPKTKQLERELKEFTGADGFACLNSATAALECCLRALGIGPGDEVITSAYTYTASCSPICHVGATPVLCDTAPDSFEMDYEALAGLVTERTKAVIPVDLGGRMCDYDRLFAALDSAKSLWTPANELQERFERVIVISDSAHSLGASFHGRPCGSVADFSTFSFHAVKNFTTAEGGGLAWRDAGFDSDAFYREIMLLSLHGQTKDALSKNKVGAWEYDVMYPGWKCNMTDIQAAMGLAQLKRYPSMLSRRREMIERYEAGLAELDVSTLAHYDEGNASSGHLMLVHLNGRDETFRNAVIEHMALAGVATNVHYKPLPLLTAYRDLGFDIADFPNAYEQYRGEITLPLHTLLSDDDIDYVVEALKRAYADVAERA
ncbi:DegT/DnrJ/EryC1/StrS family aminotransferase [Arabiibacter massiliensis]|uniref:DegT/DnrJ/EryC1/StrS family aminotransferase n=1 Tax=Arabiibacter massiliensis TaxID=1870985 RepID=UPI0009B97304|nr:DegT/DnrJ/EryC1/StrS family aminotransferase [Arabiibacter massiliensis]